MAAVACQHCAMSEDSPAYMRVANGFAKIGEAKAQRVADLSFRDALGMLAVAGLTATSMSSASFGRASDLAGDIGWRRAIAKVNIDERRARYTLETPSALFLRQPGAKCGLRAIRPSANGCWPSVLTSAGKPCCSVSKMRVTMKRC